MQRLEEHLNEHSLHDPLQSAYREGHSTETAIMKISNDITGSLDIGGCVVLASLNLSAAFDTVDHDILLQRFQSVYGINATCYSWFKSYLEHRTLKVNGHSSYSKPQQLKCGSSPPRISVRGKNLLYVCSSHVRYRYRQHHISYHNYADDTQLYISCDNNAESIREAIFLLERCISDICKWTGNNSLKINEDKTEFVIFSRNPEKYINLSLTVGTNTINISESVKNLGVTFFFYFFFFTDFSIKIFLPKKTN